MVDVLTAAAAAVFLAVVVAGAVAAARWALRPVPMLRQRVLVQLASGQALAGVLLTRRRGLLELADVVVHDEGTQAPADGRIVVEAARVAWVQVLAAREG
ncbi:hypothetical protein MXD62_16690 [Frankia sp. Mgl5]|uniref:hypothetical protein n=1 Tax=Frankia sp. Mgl5 TaxID=2933793 RepID=UPI0020105698|nr:hypothetical protein [Frankia sp. Mgl5]MCK9928794.1 hypothetical protein [Frankia sp. Mgl5]